MSRRPLVVGNWKMNAPDEPARQLDLIAEMVDPADPNHVGVVICVPATMIGRLVGHGVRIGGQDCHAEASGAHTGDISAEMLASAGATHVIVGHSERRYAYRETDAHVSAKAAAAHRAGLNSIICVGEMAEERKAGQTAQVLRRQVQGSVPRGATPVNTIIAYEPVWAIGSGAAAEPKEISAAHSEIRDELVKIMGRKTAADTRILYGGSLNSDNAKSIFGLKEVDGGLVGGASLAAIDFLAVVAAAS